MTENKESPSADFAARRFIIWGTLTKIDPAIIPRPRPFERVAWSSIPEISLKKITSYK